MALNKNLVTGLAFALACQAGNVAMADTVNGTASATVIAPLSIAETGAMDFGTIAGGPAAGTVVLATAGTRTTTGDAQIIATGAGSAGQFTVTGDASQTYSVAFSAGATLTDGGGNSMTVDTFTHTSTGLLTGGTEIFQVGATLNVGANQPASVTPYSTGNAGGSPYTVTVNYN